MRGPLRFAWYIATSARRNNSTIMFVLASLARVSESLALASLARVSSPWIASSSLVARSFVARLLGPDGAGAETTSGTAVRADGARSETTSGAGVRADGSSAVASEGVVM